MKETSKPPTLFRDQQACLDAWFAVLGPMNGASGKDHPSGIYPIEKRLPDIQNVFAGTAAARASGVALPFFAACDALSLDLLDRLLLLALVRDSLDVRSAGGVTRVRLCDAAGAASPVQQETVRRRLEEAGTLREHQLLQGDADPNLLNRFYRVPSAARDALLLGETSYTAESTPIPAEYPALTSAALNQAAWLLDAVVSEGGGAPQWGDAAVDRPGWARDSVYRRRLWQLAGAALERKHEPLTMELLEAGIDSVEGFAAFLLIAVRSKDSGGLAGSLLDAAMGAPSLCPKRLSTWLSPESPLVMNDLVKVRTSNRSVATIDGFVPEHVMSRIFPVINPPATPDRNADPASEGERTVERIVPRLRLSGIVLPAAAKARLEEALAVPAAVSRFAAEWGVGEGLSAPPGVALLFHGVPGTGKTLAAEAVAGELGKTLWRLRTDQILGKYVGETEKAIASVFEAARASGDVVLLDEADSLLIDRAETDRRWEVSMVNVLLQEIEKFRGVVILTTNRDQSLDPALERRLLARIEFRMPGETERAALWEKHLPPRAPRAADVDLPALARAFPLSGSFIRTAAFLATVRATRRPEGERILMQADLTGAAAEQFARLKTEKSPLGFVSERPGRHLSHPPGEIVCRRTSP